MLYTIDNSPRRGATTWPLLGCCVVRGPQRTKGGRQKRDGKHGRLNKMTSGRSWCVTASRRNTCIPRLSAEGGILRDAWIKSPEIAVDEATGFCPKLTRNGGQDLEGREKPMRKREKPIRKTKKKIMPHWDSNPGHSDDDSTSDQNRR